MFLTSSNTDKNSPFLGQRRNIPSLEPFFNRVLLSQIAVPTTVLSKDDLTDSVREERLDLPYWTMILTICDSVCVSKHLDTPI